MNQTERIDHMEKILTEAAPALEALCKALEDYRALCPRLRELSDYYESPEWMEDYEADEAGKIPADLKRGVLSQDTLYDLFAEEDRLKDEMRALL